jgi:hypothetical protein
METMDPHVVQVLAIAVAAAAMIVLGQAKGALQAPSPRRCAACGRFTRRGRRCPHCG